jgi:CheY-like chemotaxis protein
VAYDGRAALLMAESFLPSSVLLDIGMPGMDGYEVARRLRQDERFAGMRIIALTGWGQESDRRQTRNRGFTHHLTKPVSLEELHRNPDLKQNKDELKEFPGVFTPVAFLMQCELANIKGRERLID